MEKNQPDSKKVLVIGLDGGTLDLVRPWAREGRLPTFKRLMEEGLAHDLEVELPPGTVPNWPSFMTGKNAGKHGVIHWFSRTKDLSKWSVVNSQSIKEKMIWEIVESYGKKFISMNVPLTYPPKALSGGLMVTGLLTPPSAKDFTYPPELRNEIESEVGRYKVYPDEIYREGKEEKFVASLMETLEIRFRTSRYLMDRYPWDLFMIVFSETDAIQHAFWKFIDPAHPKYDETLAKRYGNGIFQVYQRIDFFLGEYLKGLAKDTTLIVMSDHGAGPFYRKFYTNNWLRSQGLLTIKKDLKSQIKYQLFRHGFTLQNIYRVLLKVRLENTKKMVNKKEAGESLIRKFFLSYEDIDWTKTFGFAFGGFGQIYLNVKEKGEDGKPTDAYRRGRDRIIQDLQKVEVPEGGLLIDRIYAREDLYKGPHCSLLPDIIFVPRRGYTDPGEFEFFSHRIFDEGVGASGSHRQNGIFLIWGELVRRDGLLKGVKIHDLAPTILHLLGIPVLADMDGRVLAEVLQEEWLANHPIRYKRGETAGEKENLIYSEGEEKEIREQLKGLGYLG